ncbi:MAG: EamA family transporter [Spirochaetae bacterium HGW-Spirochaetae-9]|nr:MAG: EamA family transporter [Spirochaetae bacterium HGW-Spirochaetae-9]
MKTAASVLYADALLLLTAAIWGFAFVAQRVGMDAMGPFAFNAVRYAVGAIVLLPLIRYRRRNALRFGASSAAPAAAGFRRLLPFAFAGGAMFIGASLQQLGIVTTTAGNAAFVTSLYVVIVPLIGSFFGRKTGLKDYLAALIAVAGLYIITVGFGSGFSVAPGDLLVLAGSLFWALHIIVIGRFASSVDSVELSAGQFAVCGILSLAAALIFEPQPFQGTLRAAIPILYGGVFSCGVAFTLQIVAQRHAPPAHASIILAMEGLFGAIGGVLLLGEAATLRLLAGGALMLGAAILSQMQLPGHKGIHA